MVEFLVYDLKVAVLVAVFYMFYRLLLSRETFHRVNRVVLLSTAVASFLLPLCVVTLHRTEVLPSNEPLGTFAVGTAVAAVEPQVPLWQQVAVGVFLVGAVVTLGRQLLGLCRLWWLIAHSEHHPQTDGTVIAVADRRLSPFSWMHYIVLSRGDYEAQDAAVLAHERGHICQHHTLDVLLVDTLTALQWFNPAMWMLRQDLRAIHEYEADAAVLSHGINMRQYQYLLIQKAVGHCGYSVANGITHSTLKNRISMMLHKKSSRASLLKLLALVPIVGTVVALQARTVTDYVYTAPQKKTAVKKSRRVGVVKLPGQDIELKSDTGTYKGVNVHVVTDKDHLERPLFIVDGKRVENTDEFARSLDPATVAHIDVLKDKSATGLYGEAGKNGVVVITTKKYEEEHKAPQDGEVVVNSYNSQDTDDDGYEKVFDVVEQMPEFPGGTAELMKFLSLNVRYPEAALKAGTQGRVIVSFIVEANGAVGNVKVVKKVSDDLDAEAVRLVGSMPKWQPGMQNGKPVRVKYTMPVTFRLS
ncbi:MAG: TonB family protein [Prevotella sp.]|nr:TonB family protein [Prevotella sp.]